MKLNLSISGKELSLLLVVGAIAVVHIFAPEKADAVARILWDLLLLYRQK